MSNSEDIDNCAKDNNNVINTAFHDSDHKTTKVDKDDDNTGEGGNHSNEQQQ